MRHAHAHKHTHIRKCTHTATMVVANRKRKETVVSVVFSNCHASVDGGDRKESQTVILMLGFNQISENRVVLTDINVAFINKITSCSFHLGTDQVLWHIAFSKVPSLPPSLPSMSAQLHVVLPTMTSCLFL